MSWLRILVATVGFGGALLFGAAFVASYARPAFVEEFAANVIRAEVEDRVRDRVAEFEGTRLGAIGTVVAQRNAEEIARVRQRMADTLQARVARIAAEMRDPDCECRRTDAGVAGNPDGSGGWKSVVLSQANERLTTLIRAKYMEVSAGLTREFRIFTVANAAVPGDRRGGAQERAPAPASSGGAPGLLRICSRLVLPVRAGLAAHHPVQRLRGGVVLCVGGRRVPLRVRRDVQPRASDRSSAQRGWQHRERASLLKGASREERGGNRESAEDFGNPLRPFVFPCVSASPLLWAELTEPCADDQLAILVAIAP